MRELGGLYVLGTERHESRRIDNQLRGRSGRQGDPGESRFYLSLEDELMRLFATGLMQRVMDKSFPDDVPLESKMVSKAVERAQGTVEDRNFEIRKDVLKYDEVMNEQRKIIYRRRQQILDGEDLRDDAVDAIESAIGRLVDQYCGGEFAEEWDVRRPARRRARRYFPTRITKEQLDDVSATRRRSSELLRRRRHRAVRREGRVDRRRDAARHRAPRDALGDRPALARAPLRDGLPPGGHQPAGHGPAGPALGVAARGLRHVRGDDGPDRGRLRPVRVPPPGRGRRRSRRPRCSNVQYSAPERPGAGLDVDREPRWRPQAADGADRRSTTTDDRRRSLADEQVRAGSRCGSRRRRAATSPASAGAARSTSCATGVECATSPRTWLISRAVSRDAHHYLGIDDARKRLAELEERSVGARPLGRPRPGAQGQRRALASCATTSSSSTSSSGGSPTCRRCSTSRAKKATSRVEPEIVDERRRPARRRSTSSSCARCSAASTTSATRSAKCTRARAAPTRRTGPQMLLRMFTRWARDEGLRRSRSTRSQEGQEAGITSATFIIKGRYAYGMLAGERGVHRLIRISPFDAQRAPPDRVRVVRLRARARSRPRSPRSIRATCASTRTARRARAAST